MHRLHTLRLVYINKLRLVYFNKRTTIMSRENTKWHSLVAQVKPTTPDRDPNPGAFQQIDPEVLAETRVKQQQSRKQFD